MSIFGVTSKHDDLRKQTAYITVWAEEANKLNRLAYEWGFGDGTSGCKNSGYTMLAKGKILRMGLASENTDMKNNSNITVQIVKNGEPVSGYTIYKQPGKYSAFRIFDKPLVMEAGSVLNFKTLEGKISRGEIPTSYPEDKNVKTAATVVSVLIELTNL